MIQNLKLASDLTLLMSNEKWEAVRAWFNYTEDGGTTRRIQKVLGKDSVTNEPVTVDVDTNVKEEFIDKVLLWGHTCMPEYLKSVSPEFHRDLIAFYFSRSNEYVAAPRGFSKTTIVQMCTAFSIVNKLDTFIVIVEKSFTEASEVISGVRKILKEGKQVKQIYGFLHNTVLGDTTKDPDAKGDLLINGVRIRGKGFNTTIRGLKSDSYRPSRIVLDDVETDEHINNPEQRKKYLENFNKGIQPSIDIDGVVKVFGTILHFDSLLMNLIKWHQGKVYRAYDPKNPLGTLLWKRRWSYEKLQKKKQEMTDEKGSSAFTQEYLNDPVSDDERTFKQQWLWNEKKQCTLESIKDKLLNGYAAIDVADSTKDTADWTGVVVHLVDRDGKHYRVSCRRERRNILGKVDLIFEIWQKWKEWGLVEIGVEKKAFNDEIYPLLALESAKRQIYPIVTELRPLHNSKTSRIRGNLQGPYETGRIWTIVDNEGRSIEDTEELKNELYNFPSSKKDDLCLTGDTEVATIFGNKKIKDLKIGNKVITPFGIRRVLANACTGEKEVLSKFGIRSTDNHPIFVDGVFDRMDTVAYNGEVNHLTFSNICLWKYKKLLSLMEKSINSWEGKESIILVNQQNLKNGKILKDYMWRSGNGITKKQYKKVLLFTIKMVTLLITTLIIWSVYRGSNISRNMVKRIGKITENIKLLYWIRREKKQMSGTDLLPVENGIDNMQKTGGKITKLFQQFVCVVKKHLQHSTLMSTIVPTSVLQRCADYQGWITNRESVCSAEKNLQLTNIHIPVIVPELAQTELCGKREKVYNITVEEDHVFYGNGILVGNCDAEAYLIDIAKAPMGDDPEQTSRMKKRLDPNDPFAGIFDEVEIKKQISDDPFE